MTTHQANDQYKGLSAIPMIYFKEMVLDRTIEPPQWFDIAAGLGLEATEVHDRYLRSYEPRYLETLAEQIQKGGLAVSQVIGAADFTNPDPERREAALTTTRQNLDAAAILGATCVRLTAGQEHSGQPHTEGVRLAVDGMQRALEYAETTGIFLAYENHYKDYFWPAPDFSRHTATFLEILDGLRDTSIKVNFDCSNQVVNGEDPVTLLRQVREYVVHVHCSDRVASNAYPHAVTGEGVVDYPAIFELLKVIDYSGWLSVEYGGDEGLDGLRRSIQNVRRLWSSASA